MPSRLDRLDEVEQAVQRVQVGLDLRDLRADVAVDARHLQPRQRRPRGDSGQRLVVRDAELVVLQPGGDVGVRAGVDVGVDAQADRRRSAAARPPPATARPARAALSTLKQRTPTCSAWRISARVLPTPEKTTRRGSPPAASTRCSSPPETMSKPQPARAKVCSTARLGVGLHRIADQVRPARQCALVGRPAASSMARCE